MALSMQRDSSVTTDSTWWSDQKRCLPDNPLNPTCKQKTKKENAPSHDAQKGISAILTPLKIYRGVSFSTQQSRVVRNG